MATGNYIKTKTPAELAGVIGFQRGIDENNNVTRYAFVVSPS